MCKGILEDPYAEGLDAICIRLNGTLYPIVYDTPKLLINNRF